MKTEDKIIIEHTRNWFADSSWSIERFAVERLVPMLEQAGLIQTEDTQTADEFINWRKKKAVQVGRVMKGTTQFPLAWKWFWLGCLPDSHKKACEHDLMAVAGKMNVALPHASEKTLNGTQAHIQDVIQEFSEFIASSKPAHDGRYDQNDNPEEVIRFIDEALDVVSALIREVAFIEQGTGCKGKRHQLKLVIEDNFDQ